MNARRSESQLRRNLFEIENARNLTRDELVSTFVPTRPFWRVLSAKNNLILGARGSGKTAVAKMLSHDHLALLRDERAIQAIKQRAFMGIYVPTSIEWVGGLKNKPWMTEAEAEHFFQWRLNIATCLALVATLRSCLLTYVADIGERALTEQAIAGRLATDWSAGECTAATLRGVRDYLEDVEFKKQQELARARAEGKSRDAVPGFTFETPLFVPLRRGIVIASRPLDVPETTAWLLCLDEAEFLQPLHHRILNSHMRSHSGNLFLKITTTPYGHHTLETNTGVPLSVGHDLEYVYIDQDPVGMAADSEEPGRDFATQIFYGRSRVSGAKYRRLTPEKLLGTSPLLEPRNTSWAPDSANMALLKKYADELVVHRAERLASNPPAFQDQISRKIHGALLLRDAVERAKGREELDVYAGYGMAVRCGDGNPRRLIRIFNSFLLETRWLRDPGKHRDGEIRPIPARQQTRILTSFSTSTLTRIQTEEECGPQLYELILRVGQYMRRSFHEQPLRTDQVSSLIVSKRDGDGTWRLVERAVALGLLFPNVSANSPDQMPLREGRFHFAYVLAPYFRLLPRRGKARSLALMLEESRPAKGDGIQKTLSYDPEAEE